MDWILWSESLSRLLFTELPFLRSTCNYFFSTQPHNALHTCAVVGVDCRATMSEANARQAAETTASSGANCYVYFLR